VDRRKNTEGKFRCAGAFFFPIEKAPLDLRAVLLLLLALLVLLVQHLPSSLSRSVVPPSVQEILLLTDTVQQDLAGKHSARTRLFFHQPLPVNQADSATLTMVPGIGPKLAAAIVSQRSESGALGQAEDLLHVRGIGREYLQRLQPWLSFE